MIKYSKRFALYIIDKPEMQSIINKTLRFMDVNRQTEVNKNQLKIFKRHRENYFS